jgi:hypothetical protein
MRFTQYLRIFVISGLSVVPAVAHHHGRHHIDDCCDRDHHYWGGAANPGWTSIKPAPRTLDGTIAEIIYLPAVDSNGGMVEARLVSDTRSTLVRLAPVALLKKKGLVLREGDTISLTGYAVTSMEGELLVAVEIRKGEQRIALRDARGRLID